MSLSIDQKKAVVTEVTQALSAAQAAVLAEYRGLTVAQITAVSYTHLTLPTIYSV